jgi:uncharacterized protein YdeI (YjbR/CyaY-like superfamily)
MKTNPKVDFHFTPGKPWQAELSALRAIALSCPLTEELKWGQPCYTLDGANIVLIHAFKEYCALLFMKGAVMKDPKKILIQQTENVQAGRQIRFTGLKDITKQRAVLKAYIMEAIAVEKAGVKVVKKTTAEYRVPVEFQVRLNSDAKLKAAFAALTPGRQRGYLYYFGGAKQAKTRAERVEKYASKIMQGLGFDD